MITYSLPDIPAAADIDYTDADETYAYHILIGRYYQLCGGFDTYAPDTAALRYLDTQTIYWLTAVEPQLIHGPITAVPDLLEAYDRLHLLCRRRPATRLDNAVRRNTVNRWLAGEKTLNDTQIMLLLWPLVDADYRHAEPRFQEYCSHVRATWVDELLRYGKFRNTPLAEAYQRLRHLLSQDLFAYITGGKNGETRKKQTWVDTYRVSDPTMLDTTTLRAYIPFARAAAALDTAPLINGLFAELASRPDLHPLYREALEITLAQYQPA